MMVQTKHSIEERLLAAQVAIDSALSDADILAALTPFSYDEARLQEGRALYEEALALVNQQKAEYGEQYEATEKLHAAWETANTAYMRALKVARLILKGNPRAEAALILRGKRKKSLSGWIEQATAFYTNLLANPDFMAEMAQYTYDEARVTAEAALVQAVVEANVAQAQERGEAQEATKQRDARLDALDAWLSKFKGFAEVALADHPQRLEKLGFGPVS